MPEEKEEWTAKRRLPATEPLEVSVSQHDAELCFPTEKTDGPKLAPTMRADNRLPSHPCLANMVAFHPLAQLTIRSPIGLRSAPGHS